MRFECRIFLACFFTFLLLPLPALAAAEGSEWTLSDQCPPGFELIKSNRCQLRTLYQQYDSLRDSGVGGLKTALPAVRDGFTPQQIDLGRYLFFDPVLSSDQQVACSTCHDPQQGFSDGLGQSVGVDHTVLPRSAPSLWNVAFFKVFFWDGRAQTLEQQMLGPLFAPEEMGNSKENLVKTLNGIPAYRELFRQAFPVTDENATQEHIMEEQIYTAIAAFESSLISLNSRYDRYAQGYHAALNDREIQGMNVFRSFVARCAECHTPPLFTNQQIAVIGVPEPDGMPRDIGAEKTFNDRTLRAGFKVPSLRNIAQTAPYMHSGRFANLRDAVEFYTKGRGHALADGEQLYLHWHIWEPELTDAELDLLVDFLKTLSDESFIPQVPERLPSGLPPARRNGPGLSGELLSSSAVE